MSERPVFVPCGITIDADAVYRGGVPTDVVCTGPVRVQGAFVGGGRLDVDISLDAGEIAALNQIIAAAAERERKRLAETFAVVR